mgnify:CR=1 FL=1
MYFINKFLISFFLFEINDFFRGGDNDWTTTTKNVSNLIKENKNFATFQF